MMLVLMVKRVLVWDYNYQDYTTHKDNERKQRYIDRHRKNESWGKNGVGTAGFTSKKYCGTNPRYKQV